MAVKHISASSADLTEPIHPGPATIEEEALVPGSRADGKIAGSSFLIRLWSL
jgi:hypothetical protein